MVALLQTQIFCDISVSLRSVVPATLKDCSLHIVTKYLKCTKKDTRPENLNINNLHIEPVQQYKYLGSIISDSNSTEEEIKERTALGIKAYYANQKFFKSRLVTSIRN